jgi:hypothetical protein
MPKPANLWSKIDSYEKAIDLEIPNAPRSLKYRFFEILPAAVSYGVVILLITLSIFSPLLASILLLTIIIALLVRAVGIAYHTIKGYNTMKRAAKVNWHDRLQDLETPEEAYKTRTEHHNPKAFEISDHIENLRKISLSNTDGVADYPKPSQVYHLIIVTAYNESLDTLRPTLQSIADSTFDHSRMLVVIAYEQRGGAEIAQTAATLRDEFASQFSEFFLVEHPDGLPDEIVGKGANITYAGRYLFDKCQKLRIPTEHTITTTIDSDNRVDRQYFDLVAYEYIVHEGRKRLSFQPVSLFMNNIWDAPALMRVVAVSNSFWNVISTMRPHTLRNFASHSQPLSALVEMDFWSKRTIVEDGHQFWRSYFHFDANYAVISIRVPIYQDAVLSHTWWQTIKAQFIQVRRWDYGASDVAYVANHLFSKKRKVPFWDCFFKLARLLEGHTSLAYSALVVTFGGWLPLLINPDSRHSVVAHQLPSVISNIQTIAMVGIFITIITSIRMLPPRPKTYTRWKTILMVCQWILMPVASILYSSVAAFYSQTRLALGLYMEKFDVTTKAVKKP